MINPFETFQQVLWLLFHVPRKLPVSIKKTHRKMDSSSLLKCFY